MSRRVAACYNCRNADFPHLPGLDRQVSSGRQTTDLPLADHPDRRR